MYSLVFVGCCLLVVSAGRLDGLDKREASTKLQPPRSSEFRKCIAECKKNYACQYHCYVEYPAPSKHEASGLERHTRDYLLEFDNCMETCRETNEVCQKRCYPVAYSKREASEEEQTSRDTTYDFDYCMSSCNWSRAACQQMCYNRIRETYPGKREARKLAGDGHFGKYCETKWVAEECTDAQYSWHKCMVGCSGSKPYCRDYCSRAGQVRKRKAIEAADFDKRGAELEEHGVKRVGAIGHDRRFEKIDKCNFQLQPYLVGKCPTLQTYYTYNKFTMHCERKQTCSQVSNRFETLEDCEKECRGYIWEGPKPFGP